MGDIAVWDRAEAALKSALDVSGQPWSLNEGDGAFYGPKIDIILTDSDGKRHQTATVQLDFQLPERFDLTYKAPAPELEAQGIETTDPELLKTSGSVRPVIIHRAVLGSLERFMALLMEHYKGQWPFWLSPRQAIIIPIHNKTPEIVAYTKRVHAIISGRLESFDSEEGRKKVLPLNKRTFMVDVDTSDHGLNKKIVAARKAGYNVVIVVGERDMQEGTVTVEVAKAKGVFGDSIGEGIEGQQGEAWRKAKDTKGSKVVWSPERVYEFFQKLEDQYV